MRKFIALTPFLLLSVAFLGVYPATGTKAPTRNAAPSPIQKVIPGPIEDRPGTINGAERPDLIPDDVAYALFFNFLAGRRDQGEKNSLKSYIRQQPLLADIDPEALMRIADEFQVAYKAIEDEERELAAGSHNRSSTVAAMFALLKNRKLALVNQKAGALPNFIGTDGAEKVRRHVMEHVKRKVKIAPPPPMPRMD